MNCEKKANLPIVITLDFDWYFRSIHSQEFLPATVPGNVYSDLLDNGVIEDPFIGTNETKVQWVSDSTWVYHTRFEATPNVLNKDNIRLNFEGLDTYAKVYLNDHLILTSDNAFRNYQVKVKDFILPKNKLSVHFTPTLIRAEIEKNKLNYVLPEGERVFTRKAQFQYGWDWGPKLNSMGIWKPIALEAWDNTKIDNVYFEKKSYTTDKASFTAIVTLSNPPNESGEIMVKANGKNFSTSTKLDNSIQFEVPVVIEDPTFWWPHNLGKPHLYDIDIQLLNNNKITDQVTIKHGIRNISLITNDDQYGQSFYFNVNGSPVYMKGANYIPQHSLQNRVTDGHYETLLNDVVEANLNMLRVWGGGIYENDIFYDLCDQKGLLVWQDFMYACAMYPGDNQFLQNAKHEAEDQLFRLRNHPSIVLFCGNNESSEGWHRWGWQNGKTPSQRNKIWNDYQKLFDSLLPRLVAKHTKVDYWESSPKYGRGNPQYKFEGDAHDWWVWHDGYPFEHFENAVPRFMSEFGFQSFPSGEVLKLINKSEQIKIDTDAVKSHQKHHRGFELMDLYMKRDYSIPNNDKDYIYLSQLVQARGMRLGIEAHRRSKPYNMGTLYWQLNDCWPGISWSSIDYLGKWKALHYAAKHAFENVLVSFERVDDQLKVYIINDELNDIEEILQLKLINFKGDVLWSSSESIKVPASSSNLVDLFAIDSKITRDWNQVILTASFGPASNNYYFVKPKDLDLSEAEIEFEVKKVDEGFLIDLSATTFQKDVMLSSSVDGHFSDNYFDLLPQKTKKIFFETNSNTFGNLSLNSLNKITSN
ncbi:MAG: beta-mannosidase [Bacteroidia bacterium]